MTSRAGLRFLFQTSRNQVHSQFRSQLLRNRQPFNRRFQTTDAAANAPPQSLFQRLWTSEVGIKTVHFWAPVMKWAIVIAGVGDFFRPAEKLSLTQNLAITATGIIWTRWCFIIKPKNILLAAVNSCLACVGTVQVSRVLMYQRSQQGSTGEALKEAVQEVKGQAEGLEKSAEKKMA